MRTQVEPNFRFVHRNRRFNVLLKRIHPCTLACQAVWIDSCLNRHPIRSDWTQTASTTEVGSVGS